MDLVDTLPNVRDDVPSQVKVTVFEILRFKFLFKVFRSLHLEILRFKFLVKSF